MIVTPSSTVTAISNFSIHLNKHEAELISTIAGFARRRNRINLGQQHGGISCRQGRQITDTIVRLKPALGIARFGWFTPAEITRREAPFPRIGDR